MLTHELGQIRIFNKKINKKINAIKTITKQKFKKHKENLS